MTTILTIAFLIGTVIALIGAIIWHDEKDSVLESFFVFILCEIGIGLISLFSAGVWFGLNRVLTDIFN